MLALGPPSPPPQLRPRRALAAVALGLLTALLGTVWMPGALRAWRGSAPPSRVALCGFGETCRDVGCHISFPFGSPTLTWELKQAVPDAPLPMYWQPGQTLELELTANDLGAWYMGFELAAIINCPFAENGGSFELLEPDRTTIVTDDFDLNYLSHSCTCLDTYDCCGFVPEVLGSGEFRWTFRWTPPARGSGTVFLQLAINSADGDDTPNGDRISIFEIWLEEEPCPPRIEDLRVRKADCDPASPGVPEVEIYRDGGGSWDVLREADDPLELVTPAETWPMALLPCGPLADGRTLVAWSAAETCDLGGEGQH